MPIDFRVIDIVSMQVVKRDGFTRFVALSYMWPAGDVSTVKLLRENLASLEETQGLSQAQLPHIIADSIALCNDLVERFLWVDQLCIVQDDPRSKYGQIQAMDRIYRSATFTLIAALNDRHDMGLPGYSRRPRFPSTEVLPEHLACYTDTRREDAVRMWNSTIEEVVDESLWNQRAWTFQERILSRRRLYITEHQVVFECLCGFAYELFTRSGKHGSSRDTPTIAQEPLSLHATVSASGREHARKDASQSDGKQRLNSNSPLPSSGHPLTRIPGFVEGENLYRFGGDGHLHSSDMKQYIFLVEAYTSRIRNLTFERDVLDAFAGVGRALAQDLNSAMIFGLPEKHLTQALLWIHMARHQHTPEASRPVPEEIPSWSWASSLRGVDYFSWPVWHVDPRDMLNFVSLHYQDPALRKLRRLSIEGKVAGAKIESVYSQGNWRDQLSLEPGIFGIQTTPNSTTAWRNGPHDLQSFLAQQPLDPAAVAAASQHPGSLIFLTSVACLKADHNEAYSSLEIFPDDGGIMQSATDKPIDVVVICGHWKTHKLLDEGFLNLMLVARFPDENHVCRRLGVGRIKLSEWQACKPKWETIVVR